MMIVINRICVLIPSMINKNVSFHVYKNVQYIIILLRLFPSNLRIIFKMRAVWSLILIAGGSVYALSISKNGGEPSKPILSLNNVLYSIYNGLSLSLKIVTDLYFTSVD